MSGLLLSKLTETANDSSGAGRFSAKISVPESLDSNEFDFSSFSRGDFLQAIKYKNSRHNIISAKIIYNN